MFLQGIKTAEKPKGWLGHSGDSSRIIGHKDAFTSSFRYNLCSSGTAPSPHLSSCPDSETLSGICTGPCQGTAGHTGLRAPADLPLLVGSHHLNCVSHSAGTSLWLSSTHLPGKAWEQRAGHPAGRKCKQNWIRPGNGWDCHWK